MSDPRDRGRWQGLEDPWIADITTKRIESALEGLPLTLSEGWTPARLTCEIKKIANSGKGKLPQSNADAIEELRRLAGQAQSLLINIMDAGGTCKEALRSEASNSSGYKEDEHSDVYTDRIIVPLYSISQILDCTLSEMESRPNQKPRWTERAAMDWRVAFAIFLIPIFESAFDEKAISDNWSLEYDEFSPWREFYERIFKELFPEVKKINSVAVLQEAARRRPQVMQALEALEEQEATRSTKIGE